VNPTPDRPEGQADDDPRLLRAAQEYLAELEAGRRPDRRQYAVRFPDLADALTPYLDALDLFQAAPRLHSSAGRLAAAGPPPAEPLGDFRIVREIGRGGMGIVYEAVQMSLGRRVALKVLPFAAALDAKQLQRFQNEAQAAAQLHHTNIVPVYAVGVERGVHYYAMQLIEGQNLADLVAQLRPGEPAVTRNRPAPGGGADLPPTGPEVTAPADAAAPTTLRGAAAQLTTQRASRSGSFYRTVARLGAQAAEALEHAHQLGVIHRDVKPANLMVDARGNLWVTDFGLAQFHNRAGLTRTGDLLGTLRYMSPEQAAGEGAPLDPRTDVYSLGATLYELLTLEPLFGGSEHGRLLRQILHDEPRPLRAVDRSVPPELETIVLKAVSKNPAERYATAQEFADDLHRFLENKPIRARRPTLLQRARKWAQRHPSFAAASVALLVLLSAGSLVNYARERQRANEAEEQFRLAKASVDELIQVSEQELADRPDLENVRKRLLETALEYYQAFLKQRGDDPRFRNDYEATRERVEKILADLTVLQGGKKFFLLKSDDVLEDLHVTGAQRQGLQALSDGMHQRLKNSFGDFGRLSREERGQRFLELFRENDKGMRDILTPAQLDRLQQIEWQLQGPRAFDDPKVAAAMKLTAGQKERLRGIEAEQFGCGPGDHGPGGPPKPPEQPAADRIAAVLTAEQAARWKEMTGEPFQGRAFTFGPPGGPPPEFGGRGPGRGGPHHDHEPWRDDRKGDRKP
jgi:serine/threonine protein kinase